MVFKECLGVAIEKRTVMIFDRLCEEDPDQLHDKLLQIISSLDDQLVNGKIDVRFELENLFILRARQAAEVLYKAGFSDGVALLKQNGGPGK